MKTLIYKELKLLTCEGFKMLMIQFIFIMVIIGASLGSMFYPILAASVCWAYLMNVSAREKGNLGMAFMACMPYRRRQIILAKYITALLLFAIASVFGGAVLLIMEKGDVTVFAKLLPMTFISYSFFLAITLPLYLRLQAVAVQIISIVLIIGTFYAGFIFFRFLSPDQRIVLTQWLERDFPVIGLIAGFAALLISFMIAVKLYKGMEY